MTYTMTVNVDFEQHATSQQMHALRDQLQKAVQSIRFNDKDVLHDCLRSFTIDHEVKL